MKGYGRGGPPQTGGVNRSTITPSGREVGGRDRGFGPSRGERRGGRSPGFGGNRRRNSRSGMDVMDIGDRGMVTDTYPGPTSVPKIPTVQSLAQRSKSPTRPVQGVEPSIAPPRDLAPRSPAAPEQRNGMGPGSSPIHSSVTQRRDRFGG